MSADSPAPSPPARVRIAVQNSGRLREHSLQLLASCGLELDLHDRRLLMPIQNLPIDVLHVRDDDIPGLVMDGVCDLGIVGENVLEETGLDRQRNGEPSDCRKLRCLPFGACRLSVAVPRSFFGTSLQDLAGLRIATSHPRLLQREMHQRGIAIQTCLMKGSVEVAPRVGLADAICDLVSSGATLRANGLREIETLFRSTACLIQRPTPLEPAAQDLVDRLIVRMQSVHQARESKYIMLHAPRDRLEEIIRLLPGAERPTILPLASMDERVAIHAVSTETLFWSTMEQLKSIGASSILVLPIEKMME